MMIMMLMMMMMIMMTAGQELKYSSSWLCPRELVARKGAGVNIMRVVAGAGVLSALHREQKTAL